MSYIENPFRVGQFVICINDKFPLVKSTGNISAQIATYYPKPSNGTIICIDEILGEYLRFDEYDTIASFNWWKHTSFRLATLEELELLRIESINHDFILQT